MSLVRNLDAPCPTCDRPTGDHTVREWNACAETPAVDLPYEDVPADVAALRFDLEGRPVLMADHVTARALVMRAEGAVAVTAPVLLLTFGIGTPSGLDDVAEVGLVGTPEILRKIGTLLRRTANAAANRAEKEPR